MRRLPILAVLVVGLAAACGPTVPSATPAATDSTVRPTVEPEPSRTVATFPHANDVVERCDFAARYPFGPEVGVELYGSSYQPAAGSDGGSLIVGTTRPISEFDPLRATDPDEALLGLALWRGLSRASSDYKALPDLARVMPQQQNGLVALDSDGHGMAVTWCLRDGLAWSDGVPMTCSDLQYSLAWLTDIEPAAGARFGQIAAIDCPDPSIAIVRYGAPFSAFYLRVPPPMPRHYLERFSMADLRAGTPFTAVRLPELPTSGPFRVIAAVPSGSFALVRNDHFHGGKSGRPAYLESLLIRVYPGAADLIEAFRSGDVQLAEDLDPADLATLLGLGLNDSIAAAPGLAYDTLLFNLSTAAAADGSGGCSLSATVSGRGQGCPTADLALRRAIRQTIDTGAIAHALAPNDGEQVSSSIVAPQTWFFTDIAPPPITPQAAMATLDDAGWRDTNGDGVREHGNLSARIELCATETPEHRAAALLIARDLAAIGIRVVPTFVSAGQLDRPYAMAFRATPCALSRGNFDLALAARPSFLEAVDFRSRYRSDAVEPAGSNEGRVADPRIDAALDVAATSIDFAAVKDAMYAFQQAIVDEVVEIPVGSRKNIALVATSAGGRAGLGNYFQSPEGADSWNSEDWYMLPAAPTPAPTASRFP